MTSFKILRPSNVEAEAWLRDDDSLKFEFTLLSKQKSFELFVAGKTE